MLWSQTSSRESDTWNCTHVDLVQSIAFSRLLSSSQDSHWDVRFEFSWWVTPAVTTYFDEEV